MQISPNVRKLTKAARLFSNEEINGVGLNLWPVHDKCPIRTAGTRARVSTFKIIYVKKFKLVKYLNVLSLLINVK